MTSKIDYDAETKLRTGRLKPTKIGHVDRVIASVMQRAKITVPMLLLAN